MLKLINVCKEYKNGKNKSIVLDNINLNFNAHELVFILGASGSGKSTLLNIIAGNLKCDSGEIWLGNICISKLSDKLLNDYRSNVIGNIFQDYNLIEYMSVMDNVKLAYTGKKRDTIVKLLKKLNIYDKRNTIVSKLSGGEKQRVAIARALANDNSIILADEPTGALDSKMGIQVMDILKEISRNKLVIVVSHDNNLANKYASRIINIKDGKCDSLPIISDENHINYKFKKRKNKFFTIVKLAFKNLWLKRMRTLLTSLAISLGIICMMLVSNLYYNFTNEIKKMEKDIVSIFPITISNGEFEVLDNKVKKSNDKIIFKDRSKMIHTNKIDNDYLNYVKSIKKIKYIIYDYDALIPFVSDKYKVIDNSYLKVISSDYINDNYELLYGKNISNSREVLIKVDSNNNIDSRLLNYFDISSDIEYSEIVGRKIKVILNNQYYSKNGNYYVINNDLNDIYNNSDMVLTIVGVIREKNIVDDGNYIYYDNDLLTEILDINGKSDIVNSQIKSNYNVLGIDIEKNEMLSLLGSNSLPSSINIYVNSLIDKKRVLEYLNKYDKKMEYVDTMSSAIDIIRQFINVISLILIVFSIISIIISSLMVMILTNVRVLERKKEIGILRSLGSSRKDIKRLFNLENMMIGVISLMISFLVCNLTVKPINDIMYNYLEINNLFKINYSIMIFVFLINMVLIRIVGIIPVNRASRMDIVKCIYNK